MTGSPTQAEILLRKRSAKPAQSGPAQESDELAMAKAFVRAAHEVLGMRVRVLSASARTETGIEQLTPVFADHALCLAGRGNGDKTGVIALSLELVTAIIEKSTTGEVGNRDVPERAGTSIDALFAEPLLRAMLENLALTCAPELRPWIASVVLAKMPSKTDDLEFQIAEGSHRVVMFKLQTDSAREGELVALIPQPGAGSTGTGDRGATGTTRRDPAAGLRRMLLDSRTSLRADLASLDVPLKEFRDWALGSVFRIPGEAIAAVSLTQHGNVNVAKGRLGQANGNRAVRLDLPSPPIQPPDRQDVPGELPMMTETGEDPASVQADPAASDPPPAAETDVAEAPIA